MLLQQGHFREALDEFRRGHELASERPDWRYPSTEWVRQAERLVALEARLPAVIRGEDRPGDGAEATALADTAYKAGRHRALARLYAAAFELDPGWPRTCDPATVTTPPAQRPWPAPAGARTRLWTKARRPAGGSRPSIGCGPTWRSGPSRWNQGRRRPGRS